MKHPKKTWIRLGAAGLIAAAFASAAIAAESTGALEANGSVLVAAAANPASHVSLPAAASQVATRVLDAITGGSSASVAAAQRANGEPGAQANTNKGGGEASSLISAAQRILVSGTAGTVGVRPGWGCGDKNHDHSGPPGRPNATEPPGCQKQ